MNINKKTFQKEILALLGIKNEDKKENNYEDKNKNLKRKPENDLNKIQDIMIKKIKLEKEKNINNSEEENLKKISLHLLKKIIFLHLITKK